MSASPEGPCAASLQAADALAATIAAMKVLHLLHVVVAQAFYRWAMSEINPMHPDVPKIVRRQQELNEKYRRLWGRQMSPSL
jgi:hypothetical protein